MIFKGAILLCLSCVCFADLSVEKKDRLLNGFIEYYNNLPNQIYTCDEGSVQNAQQTDENCYIIEVNLKVTETHNLNSHKFLKCTATLSDVEEIVSVVNNEHQCQDELSNLEEIVVDVPSSSTTEVPAVHSPVQLDNEVQTNDVVTSGEQFIAIPRERPAVTCIGCASHVDPQAPGVNDLANIGVRQLDRHQPNVTHTLKSVVEVERQVQVVNGVRFILTVLVDYNSCTATVTESCETTNACKITILEKPWVRFADGSKYRAIMANNCTDEWRFGDDGEVIPQNPSNNKENNEINVSLKPNPEPDDGIIKASHNIEVQASQQLDKTLSNDDLKNLEEQIIPHDRFEISTEKLNVPASSSDNNLLESKEHVVKVETVKHRSDNSVPVDQIEKHETVPLLTEEKKKAIDDMLNFFDFSGIGSKPNDKDDFPRMKRSYDYDLQVMSLAERFKNIKNNLEQAKKLRKMAETIVDYINEIDMQVKTRELQDVITVEEEFENHQHFYYIQSRIAIPCDKVECGVNDKLTEICNGVIDNTDETSIQVLNAFCHSEAKRVSSLANINRIPVNDKVLQSLLKKVVKKIESESKLQSAMAINKVVDATTQRVSGTVTKISVVFDYTNCSKSVHYELRKNENCTVLKELGSNLCEVIIHDRSWLKNKEITYSCTERPLDGIFSHKEKVRNINESIADPKVRDMIQEALQYLEVQSDRNNKQKIAGVQSISSKLIAGFLTNIEFTVGYTECASDSKVDENACSFLKNEPLRKCKAQIWDRTWIEEGRQVEVSCKEDENYNHNKKTLKLRKKRSLTFVGGQSEKDINNPLYRSLAEESMMQYLQSSGNLNNYSVINIENVTVQVVSGSLTRIHFSITPIICRLPKEEGAVMNGCEILNFEDVIPCFSSIWEQPWRDFKQINVTCNETHRKKRGLPGGVVEQDPSKPHFKELAELSMKKYLQNSGNTQEHKVVNVTSATTQVVAGTLSRIDFTISSTFETFGDIISCHAEVWEQPWLNKTEVDVVNCQLNNKEYRAKRQIRGGQKEADPSDPHFKELAELSMKKYLQNSGNTQEHKVVNVTSATTQVVAGKLSRIDFTISSTSETSGEIISCHSEVWEQPWRNFKQINVTCNETHRKKRGLPGGVVEQDPSKPHFKELAELSMKKYLQNSGNTQEHKVVNVTSATTQVVAGTLSRIDFTISSTFETSGDIISCHAEVWEQPWLNKTEVDVVNCQLNNKEYRAKRQIRGGQKEADPSDPHFKELAELSMKKYLQNSGNTQEHKVVNVTSATTQVVAGKLSRIDFTISSTSETSGDIISCHSEVWEKTWLNWTEIESVNCQTNDSKYRKKRGLLQVHSQHSLFGGDEEQDPNKREYKLLAKQSLREYQHLQKSDVRLVVIEVKRVTRKVVAGIRYNIDFSAKPKMCSANVLKPSKCKMDNESVILYCNAEIWDRPWLKQKKYDVSCDTDNDVDTDVRQKRSTALGAPEEMDVNKKQYKLLAEEALRKYQNLSKTQYVHKVVKIHTVTEQVVEGSLTKITYSVSPTKCLIGDGTDSNDCEIQKPKIELFCNAEIWDRPWLNDKNIKVNCKKKKTLKIAYDEQDEHEEKFVRTKRLVDLDDYDMDEEMKYYYADRAVQQLNEVPGLTNLNKLITIHDMHGGIYMKTHMVRMYIEVASTFCLKGGDEADLMNCDELDGINHRLCLAKIWPSPDNEMVVNHVNVVCDDNDNFESITGLSVRDLLRASVTELEKNPDFKYKLVHQGEPQIIPSLDSKIPITINFVIATTNCTKDIDTNKYRFQCFIDPKIVSKTCSSLVWLAPNSKTISKITAGCTPTVYREKRSVSLHPNATADEILIQELVKESLQKLEMSSQHRYKQRLIQINSYSTKLTTGKLTTIDFDVGYTSCLKYEWVKSDTSCEFLVHLPRRHCVSKVWQRLWLKNGKFIEVECEDDETPLEPHIEYESAEMAMQMAEQALKHIEAKYPNPRKQKVIRIFSFEKQVVAGIHYRMKVEVGLTNCPALSGETDCMLDKESDGNKFCRVNIWLRPWTDHPPNYRVTCDYQEGLTNDLYHHLQAESLFQHFIVTYKPDYLNDHKKLMTKFETFKTNVRKIHELNVYERGTATYGITRFADLSPEEFSRKYLGLKQSLRDPNQVPMRKAKIPDIVAPEEFDWREFDAVTEVKNQGSCGSCWAFSVTGNIEGQWKIQSGDLVSLSEQELVDCDKLDDGCNGGLPDNAYRAIEQLGGLELEDDYPYEAEDDKCTFNRTLSRVQISGAVNISSNETDMVKWLVNSGPISIGINANAMQFYMGGVSHPWKMLCNPKNLDHGVLIVGYGVKEYPLFNKRLPYWIVKNSWGKSWGEQGYYRVFRGDGTCGVNLMASSAIL